MEKRYKDYLTRFILLHVITYAVIGIIFYQLQDYEGAFEVQEDFKLFRPTDHPLVKYSVFIQILRGGILAMFLHPFYHIFMDRKHGWILLFILLFGLTVVGFNGSYS